jgi:hypothetical protein
VYLNVPLRLLISNLRKQSFDPLSHNRSWQTTIHPRDDTDGGSQKPDFLTAARQIGEIDRYDLNCFTAYSPASRKEICLLKKPNRLRIRVSSTRKMVTFKWMSAFAIVWVDQFVIRKQLFNKYLHILNRTFRNLIGCVNFDMKTEILTRWSVNRSPDELKPLASRLLTCMIDLYFCWVIETLVVI